MLAIAFLFFFLLYLAISAGLARWVAKQAGKRGFSGRKWGVLAFLFMLGLVFWDWLPMEILYRCECATNAGIYQVKTLEEWKQENPSVLANLDPENFPEKYFVKVEYGQNKSERRFYKLPDGTELIARYDIAGKYLGANLMKDDGVIRFWLNERFYWEIIKTNMLFHVIKKDRRIVDYKTGELLAHYVDYMTDIPPIGIGGDELSDYKFWMLKTSCESAKMNNQNVSFNDLKKKYNI